MSSKKKFDGRERMVANEGRGLMGTEQRMRLRKREGAKARPNDDRPPDYFVAQINSPSAGSPESSCGAEEEGFRFRGAEVDQGE